MKFCLGIGNINKNIIYILLGGLIKFLFNLFIKDEFLSILFEHPLIMNFSSSLGLIISFIPWIIYKIRNKEINCCSKTHKYDLVYNDINKLIKYGKYKLILLSSFIDFTQTMLVIKFCKQCKVNMWIFEIAFISIFFYIIFKSKLYIHHYISIIIIISIGISLDIYLGHYIFNDLDYAISMLLKFISEIVLSLVLVIDKYIMEKKFCSPYEICFYHGIINFLLSLIFLSFSKEIRFDNYKEFFLAPSLEKFYAFIISMFQQFIYNIFIYIVNKNSTPCHILIMLVIGQFAPYIKALTKDKTSSIILIFGLLIILFFTFIFNEILEIKCLGLNKNTKKNIALRAENDLLSINIIFNNNKEDNNDINEEDEEYIFFDEKQKGQTLNSN